MVDTLDTLDFPDAIRAVIQGGKVTRLAWQDATVYVFQTGGYLKIRKTDGTLHVLLAVDADLEATDWVLVTPALSRIS